MRLSKNAILSSGSVLAAMLVAAAPAHAEQRQTRIELAAESMDTALYKLARKTGANILFSPEAVAGLRSRPVKGLVTPGQAVRRMLDGTALEVIEDSTGALIVRKSLGARAQAAPLARGRVEGTQLAAMRMPAAALAASSGMQAASAIDAPAPVAEGGMADDASSGLMEIVVTAQRRNERLQDVPISIQALSTGDLRRRAVNDTRDLGYILPSVTFTQGVTASTATFALRGVRSSATQGGVQPSTAMVVDGVPVFRQAEFIAELADVERIEVLNGPQGTLFGRNSTAGVINIVSKRPTDRLEGLVEGMATTDEEYSVRGMLNVPVTDGVRLRVNGFYRDQAPLIRNLAGPGNGGLKSYGATGKLAIDLGDRADMELSGTYSHTDSTYGQLLVIAPTPLAAAQQLALIGVPVGRGQTTVSTDSPSFDFYTLKAGTLTFNWRPTDELTITSISNLTRFTEDANIDVDGTPAGVNVGRGYSDSSNYPIQYVYRGLPRIPDRYTYFSQEVRGNYVSGPVNAVAGFYYQHLRNTYATEVDFIFDGAVIGAVPGQKYFNGSRPDSVWLNSTAAVFGDLTYALTDQIKVFGGARYTRETIDVDYSRKNYFFNLATGAFNPVTTAINDALALPTFFRTTSRRSLGNVSGRAGIQYQPSRNLNFYFSYAHGYKAPAVDLGSSLRAGVDPIIKPEIADAFEVGAKMRLFDNRAAFNIALFKQTIQDLQASTVPPGSAIIVNQLLNVGTLRSNGVEADAEVAVTPEFKLSGSLTYNDATYHDFAFNCNSVQLSTGTCPNTPRTGFQNLEGVQVAGSPKWKYALGASYEREVGASGMHVYGQVNWNWRSAVYLTLDQSPFTREPGYGLLDAAVGIRGRDDRWELQLFGKNLTDRFFYSALNSVATIGNSFGFITRNMHRYGGIRATFRF